MYEKENIDNMPEKWKKLLRYLNTKEYYEILLLDMLRANEIPQSEYNKIIADSEKSYKQFIADLKEYNDNVKSV